MITLPEFKNKNVAVLGLGRSGRSVAKSLYEVGATVFAWDDQKEARLAAESQEISLTNLDDLDWETIDTLILSPGIPHHYPAPHPYVTRAQIAGIRPVGDIEMLYRSQPQAHFIGVTGTNGKSTTTSLIGHILKESEKEVEVGGNIGIPVLNLNPLSKEGTYVLEVSSYQLEISPSLHFNVGVLLNITPDHLERHGGMEGYIAAKKLIYRNTTREDTLVISIDDVPCLTMYEALKASGKIKLLPISICKIMEEGISVKDGILYENGQSIFNLKDVLSLKGQHNWQNIAAAYGALRSSGLKSEEIIRGALSFPGLAHRQQEVGRYKNIRFINDSKATNAEATAKALSCFKESTLYCLLGGRPKEGGITGLMPYFSSIHHAFLYGEAASSFALTLEGKVPYTLSKTLKEAIQAAAQMAFHNEDKDGIVLLSPSCASFDQFKDFEERGNEFIRYTNELIDLKRNNLGF